MAYYYVKHTGSSTTSGGTTKQTGAFSGLTAAAVYGTIADAITYGATSGDFICVSDAHSYDSVSVSVTYSGPTSGDFLYIVSVDDSNCDAEKAAVAAQETIGDNFDQLAVAGRLSMHSLYIAADNNLLRTSGSGIQLYAKNCTFEVTDATDFSAYPSGDGTYFTFVNCTFSYGEMLSANGGQLKFYGGSVINTATLIDAVSALGGTYFTFVGVDLSGVSGYLIENCGSSADADDNVEVNIIGCKLHASVTFWEETKENLSHQLKVVNSSSSSAAAEYQYHFSTYGGEINDETSFYRDDSTAFPSGQKVSLKCVTDSNATPAAPFWFDMPTRYAELSTAASDLLRINLLSSATLYDSDVWAECVYPDGTTKNEYNYITTRHDNILATSGTGLTTNTDAWTGRTTENRYQIDLDTSGDAGADCVPIIRVYIAKASATVYFCPTLGLS